MHPMEERAQDALTNYTVADLPSNSVFLKVGDDLTQKMSRHKNERIHGRDDEVDELVNVITRRYRNNAVILGDPGVGKTALVEHLAWRMAKDLVPHPLRRWKLCRTSFTQMWGMVGDRPDPWPAYFKLLKDMVDETTRNPILVFIDEIHLMWSLPVTRNTLKGPLSDGSVRMIGATTGNEYARYFMTDKAFERRFQPFPLKAPTEDQMHRILGGAGTEAGTYYDVRVPPDARDEVLRLSDQYLFNRNQPDRGLDLLESSCIAAREEADRQSVAATADVTPAHVRAAVSRLTGIEASYLGVQRTRLENLALRLKERVRGQDDIIDRVAERILVTKMRLDMNPNRPDGVFLFAGPTGVGKTELGRAIADVMTGSDTHFLKLDMGSYKEPYSVNALMGQERGKSDNDEPAPSVLTQFAREHPFGVLLLDEVEKAHPEVLHLFLSILDDGTFRDRVGNLTRFSFCTVILTTNLGYGQKYHLPGLPPRPLTPEDKQVIQEAGAEGFIRKVLPKELVGRIDHVFQFRPLSPEIMGDLVLKRLDRMSEILGVKVTLDVGQVSEIAHRASSTGLGARALDRLIEQWVGVPVARMKLRGEIQEGGGPIRVALPAWDPASVVGEA